MVFFFRIKFLDLKYGSCHSSVDLSAPTLQRPRVQIPTTLTMLFPFRVKFYVIIVITYIEKRTKINNKEAGFGP